MSTEPNSDSQTELFRKREARRAELAAKSVEEKLETLIKLQKLTSELARQAGREYKEPWNIEIKKPSS